MRSGFHAPTPIRFELTESLLAEVERIGRERAPAEACGLILPPPGRPWARSGTHPQVIELPNRSKTPRDSYEMGPKDAGIELERWIAGPNVEQENIDSMVCWHTHPAGNIGPSRGDIENRPEDISMLVVTLLPESGHIITLF